jgi:CRISPR-associated protein Csb2
MIAIGIRYLTGYAAAADRGRDQVEWPPHPGRVFMALAAAHFESEAAPAERSALEWLERADPPPALCAGAAFARTVMEAYVPVNDSCAAILNRSRQLRKFFRARLEDDTVYLVWSLEPPQDLRAALSALCARVTRVGHSSSLVQMWVVENADDVPECNWILSDGGQERRLRVPGRGTLRELELAFNQAARDDYDRMDYVVRAATRKQRKKLMSELEEKFPDGRPSLQRPQIVSWRGYAQKKEPRQQQRIFPGPFDPDFIILTKVDGNAHGIESTIQLTGALRNAAMKVAGERPPEWLSGHALDRAPSQLPHVAFFLIPYVGYEHADAHVMGLALAIPRPLASDQEVREVLGKFFFRLETGESTEIRLWRPHAWTWTLERETRERPPRSLQHERWNGPSRMWGSVTPVVLHHYPKRSRESDVERIVSEAFASALLPQPERIQVQGVSAHAGAGHARGIPSYDEGGSNLCRYQVHVVVRFPEPVQGPVLVGRGRYRGYGLCAPLPEE